MKGHRIGYVRVSSFDQNPDRQLEGIELDRVFSDTASGKDAHRPALIDLIQFVREGDTVVVHSMDRLARNLDDLRRLVTRPTPPALDVGELERFACPAPEMSAYDGLLERTAR